MDDKEVLCGWTLRMGPDCKNDCPRWRSTCTEAQYSGDSCGCPSLLLVKVV